MNESKSFKFFAILLIVVPISVICLRVIENGGFTQLRVEYTYVVDYLFDYQSNDRYQITTFLPVNDRRQEIFLKPAHSGQASIIFLEEDNKRIQWSGNSDSSRITYSFEFTGRAVSYSIDPTLPYVPTVSTEFTETLKATQSIQSEHPKVAALANELSQGKESILAIVRSFYDYVYAIPSTSTSELTDAIMALDRNEASCNGKSRLLVALCRNSKIPARVVGGLILEETTKKTSHAWVEVYMENTWVPFDALNGYFAALPAHYLELYRGDHFLITHSKGMSFDYNYAITKERTHDYPVIAALNVWELIDEADIPADMLRMVLLLPFGAFLVAIFKNVIGLKTYGVFLPVLISLSLLQTGIGAGLVLFTAIIGIVALVNFPLEKWGIQYNAKVSAMLIAVVITSLISVKFLHSTGWLSASAPLFFPIIILTIVSERVARKIEEDGLLDSMKLYGSTLIVTVLIYFVLASQTIQQFVMTFPEIIISIAGINLLLGKWIGLRVLEYYRFYNV